MKSKLTRVVDADLALIYFLLFFAVFGGELALQSHIRGGTFVRELCFLSGFLVLRRLLARLDALLAAQRLFLPCLFQHLQALLAEGCSVLDQIDHMLHFEKDLEAIEPHNLIAPGM